MNRVCLSGNLCKDVELKKTSSKKAVVSNTIAVSRDFKNDDGEYETDFIDIVVWEKTAEYLSKYAKKGDRIELVGKWQVRKYQTSDGKNRVVNECVVEWLKITNSKKQEEVQPVEEDDLPF